MSFLAGFVIGMAVRAVLAAFAASFIMLNE